MVLIIRAQGDNPQQDLGVAQFMWDSDKGSKDYCVPISSDSMLFVSSLRYLHLTEVCLRGSHLCS